MPYRSGERYETIAVLPRALAILSITLSRLAGSPVEKATSTKARSVIQTAKYLDIIRRFGRFPHRNAILGRKSSAEEEGFLAESKMAPF